MAINPLSYKKHKTLEVRLHHGCLDSAKLGHWIDLLLAIVNSRNLNVGNADAFLNSLPKFSSENKAMYKEIALQYA
jgi:hypothetical protein